MKHLFIINPAAGKGKTLKYIPEIERVFEKRNDEYFIEITQKPGHATEIVKQYVCSDNYRVYSVGGDGTLNEVLNGMANSGSSLAVIPGGSGNDFIRSVDNNPDLNDIVSRTVDGKEVMIDLAKVNGRYFVNISSIGFDADVVYNAIKFKKLPFFTGSLAYLTSILFTLLTNKCSFLNIRFDGQDYSTQSLLAAVANGRFYGGGILAAPDAILNDGLFDICLVKNLSRPQILTLFPQYIKGRHGKIPQVSFHKARKVEIRSSKLMTLNIDGEISRVNEAVFEIIPMGLNIVVPLERNNLLFSTSKNCQ